MELRFHLVQPRSRCSKVSMSLVNKTLKFSNINNLDMPIYFVEIVREAAMQNLSHFSTKISVCVVIKSLQTQ